jgi:hypothetical protein
MSNTILSVAAGRSPAVPWSPSVPAPPSASPDPASMELRQTFESFVGQTFFGQLLRAMRKTQNKPAYFHGGRAEEIFQQQLDQVVAERLAEACGEQFAGPMFELFSLQRS